MKRKNGSKWTRIWSRIISMMLVIVLMGNDCMYSVCTAFAAEAESEVQISEDDLMEQLPQEESNVSVEEGLQEESDVSEEVLESGDDTLTEENSPVPADGLEEDPKILFELEEKRQQGSKHYRLSNGTIMAADYGMAVHYMDEDGTWMDIDNRFVYETADGEDNMEGFATAEGDVEFKFAPNAVNGTVVRATSGKYSVGFEFLRNENSDNVEVFEAEAGNTVTTEVVASPITFIRGTILNREELTFVPIEESEDAVISDASEDVSVETDEVTVPESSSSEVNLETRETIWVKDWIELDPELTEKPLVEQAALENAVTSIGYENILPGISLQYIACGDSLKEYILVNEPQESYQYEFVLNLENLVPDMREDGSVLLKDAEAGTIVYEIPSAYMTDAAGEQSEAVEMELIAMEDGTYHLLITADAQWINAEDRVFPVQIDPTLNKYLNSMDTIRGGYVREGEPNVSSTNYGSMYVGYDSSGNKNMITYIQLRNLPVLPKNSVICGAVFNMEVLSYSKVAYTGMSVQAKKVTDAAAAGIGWDSVHTWNNRPATDSVVMDFKIVSDRDLSYYAGWNITEIVKKHYMEGNVTDKNLIFALEAYGNMTDSSCANAAFNLFGYGVQPVLQILYRDTKGVEDYYTYQTQDIENAGTGYVGDYTSQLTLVRNDAFYDSTILPYDLGFVYNSAYSSNYFSSGGDIHTKNFSNMYVGTGWKLTAQETITSINVENVSNLTTYLVYNDADGTEHYFKQSVSDSSKYEDEDGLNLTITKSGTTYTMTDKKDNVKVFTNGYLTKIKDANGNQIHIVYNGGTYSANTINTSGSNRITSIVSQPNGGSAKTIFTLTYDAKNFLTEIADAYERKYQYVYEPDITGTYRLTETRCYDKYNGIYVTEAQYRYSPEHGGMLLAYDVQSGTGVQYTYEGSATGYRINGFHEYTAATVAGTQTTGVSVKSTSDHLRKTAYTSSGTDRKFNTSDDVTTTYLFNNAGLTVNAESADAEGDMLGVTAAVYETDTGNSKINNRISNSISTGQAGVNLFSNGGFEKYSGTAASGWIHSNSGGETSCREDSTDNGPSYSGNMHYNLFNGSTSSYASIYQSETLQKGKTYTFSAMVNTVDTVQFGDGGGVYLKAAYHGYEDIAKSTVLSHATDVNVDEGWQRISVTFTMTYTASIRLYLCWEDVYGILRADDLQLEEGEAASRFNHVYNGSFEESSATDGWTITSDVSASSSEKKQGSKSVSMAGTMTNYAYAKQTIQLNKSSDTTFLLSGWAKGQSVPDLETGVNEKEDIYLRFWNITLELNYSDGTKDSYELPMSAYVTDWQYAAMAIVPKSEGKTISTAVLSLQYGANANTAYFDNISLVEEPAQTYKYDDEGNLISVKSGGNGEEDYTYNAATQNLMSVGTEGSGTYTYKYENTSNSHLPTGIINDTVTMGITYDTYGETTGTTLTNSKDSYKMTSTAAYSEGLLTKVTDNTGGATTYGYDGSRRLNKVTYPGGQIIETGYDDIWEYPYQTYQSGKVSLNYTYTDGKLSEIVRGGYITEGGTKQNQSYKFAYDDFGNCTRISVGNKRLADYSYNTGNGTLESIYYGFTTEPLATVSYAYDCLDRVKSANYYDNKQGIGTSYGYMYSSDGSLSGVTQDGKLVFAYEYDSLGRLIHSSALENGKTVLYTDHKYDTSNRITYQGWQIGTEGFSETYRYNTADGTLSSMTTDGDTLNFTYDNLKRLDACTTPVLKTDYAYRNRNTTTTTAQVSSIQYLKTGTSTAALPKLTYTYDTRGNIKTETPYDRDATAYTYDQQNQLKSTTLGNIVTTYGYDTYGNIRSIRQEQTLFGMERSHTFTYADNGEWKDLLTGVTYIGYGGDVSSGTLTYDSVGNPLTYFNGLDSWNFTWKYGRQLSVAANGSDTISYTYDANGVRKSKIVNGVEHKYVTLDGKVVRETYGNVTVDYFYDNAGRPFKIIVDDNGTEYVGYYALNLQGDVIGILDEAGNVDVEYIYDGWGNPSLRTIAGELYEYNALKYRGYYHDEETGFYYLNNRYYDPVIGRFINPDTTDVLDVQSDLYDKNLYAYCDNNPIVRVDSTGAVWETVFDVASLAGSVVEVAINPTDVMAWAGLVGDAVDLIPFVTGVGEAVKVINVSSKMDDVVDAAKALRKNVNKSVGVYEITYKSGKNYVGKGGYNRAIKSAIDHAKGNRDTVTSIRWKASSSSRKAFKEEYGLQTLRGVGNASTTYNKIWSPGKKYYLNSRSSCLSWKF